jgi:ectoine hydroxylase-related dioxygenase (phytanoyl-CoA dioxygenase family)
MNAENDIPIASYGVIERTQVSSEIESIVEQVKNVGYAVLESGYSLAEIEAGRDAFAKAKKHSDKAYGADYLEARDELNTIRAPMFHGDPFFLNLIFSENLLAVVGKIIQGKFILNQQNCLINPPKQRYNQGVWHRDLPYQHFTSSTPLAINALYCVDDFTTQNGATYVLPASHKLTAFPSSQYIINNALQIEAPAGSFVIMDCMMYHTGGFNRTDTQRRAVNHVFTIPFIKQQIQISGNIALQDLSLSQQEILGITFTEPKTVREFYESRKFT